jgi:beta-glucosidase
MKAIHHRVLLCLILITSRPAVGAPLTDVSLEGRVQSLLARMTLEEKAGQLTQYAAGVPTGPGTPREDYRVMIGRGEVGSLLNVVGPEKANAYQRIAVTKSRLGIPLLFGFDVIHGDRTTFPVPLALASSFDPALVEATARMAARESRSDGINWVFSPMVDISRDARWGRVVESAGEEPCLGAALAAAYIRGYQQKDLASPGSVAACVKHFAAYGAAIAGREYNAVEMSGETLRQVYLPPYKAAVDAGAATVMSAFDSLNGVPCCANSLLLTNILRREWNFRGFVVSDWGAVGELVAHGVAADGDAAAIGALTAGTDMDMESALYRPRLPDLVRSGRISQETLDEAVRRVLRVKFALGLFEHPYAPEGVSHSPTPESRALALHAAEESVILLKNDPQSNSDAELPLGKGRKIALLGPLADSAKQMLGSWHAAGDSRQVITLRQALEERARGDGTPLLFAKGTDINGNSDAGFGEAIALTKQADIAVVALGEDADEMTGEAASRAYLSLPGNQEQFLQAIVATGKPVVLILCNGHPLSIPWAAGHVPAILEAWYPGIEAGHALASILYGDTNPSAKLPVSLPRSVGQEPLYLGELPTGRPADDVDLSHPPLTEKEKFCSRYIDEDNSPLYPYGWGLSYTGFSYSPITLDAQRITTAALAAGRALQVSVEVRNTGPRPGVEVVQLYLHNRGVSIEQPVRRLVRFERIALAPGKSARVKFQLSFGDLAFYDGSLRQTVEPSDYDLFIGGSSAATNTASFEVTH